jgi:CheY-like chemotaxis protein
LRKRRVLLVDDKADGLMLNALLIRSMGHEVKAARSAMEAVDITREFRPDIAFIDLVLPDIDGCQLAKDLIEAFGEDNISVYILTGYPDDRARQRARAAGCTDFLTKPIETAVLERLLGTFK